VAHQLANSSCKGSAHDQILKKERDDVCHISDINSNGSVTLVAHNSPCNISTLLEIRTGHNSKLIAKGRLDQIVERLQYHKKSEFVSKDVCFDIFGGSYTINDNSAFDLGFHKSKPSRFFSTRILSNISKHIFSIQSLCFFLCNTQNGHITILYPIGNYCYSYNCHYHQFCKLHKGLNNLCTNAISFIRTILSLCNTCIIRGNDLA